MANSKKVWVAFSGNLTIPGAVVGEDNDVRVQSGEPVQVTEDYADSVVQDGIAVRCEAPSKKKAKKTPAKNDGGLSPDQNANVSQAELLELAQTDINAAQLALEAAVGAEAMDKAQADLTVARDAYAALQS